MKTMSFSPSSLLTLSFFVLFVAALSVLLPQVTAAQGLTGALIGTVKDEQGAAIPGAQVRVTSQALIGGPRIIATDETGRFRFPNLTPGSYMLDIEIPGFAPIHEQDIQIGAAATMERTVVLKVAGVAESIVVEAAGSRIEARGSGFETHFGQEYMREI